jgi:Cu(I)/Ag(I) efflux system membrane protein CusA/SilA
MIEKIIEFSARNKYLVLLFTLVAVLGATYTMKRVPLDAIPDLSDTQVIVYSRWDRSPDIIEDQVTYPIVTALLGAPKVKSVRGFLILAFPMSILFLRTGRTFIGRAVGFWNTYRKYRPLFPTGVKTELGPDATGVGWVYQYALVDKTGQSDLAQLRSFQDWYLRYWLQSVPGVAEVASIGGFKNSIR